VRLSNFFALDAPPEGDTGAHGAETTSEIRSDVAGSPALQQRRCRASAVSDLQLPPPIRLLRRGRGRGREREADVDAWQQR